jgi:hypothetical protein
MPHLLEDLRVEAARACGVADDAGVEPAVLSDGEACSDHLRTAEITMLDEILGR